MATIEFFGACESVTGSQHLLSVNGRKILLDCGLFQGKRSESEWVNRNFPFNPKDVDAIIVSHAHIDHSGNLPNIVKQGFAGKIFLTPATGALLRPMLLDSARIQEHDVEYLNKKLDDIITLEPIYTEEDAQAVFSYFHDAAYHEWFTVAEGVRAQFLDAGHILGAALVVLEITGNGKKILVGYTGDLGRKFLPILRDPEQFTSVDYLISESTYGDRLHEEPKVAYKDLAEIINFTVKKGGKLVIPSFAVARAQELLYIIHELKDTNAIPHGLPVYLDSPLAIEVSKVYEKYEKLYDRQAYESFLKKNDNPFTFTGLKFTPTVQDSKAINSANVPSIIISASGMCEFGRIRHHLKNTIDDVRNTVAIVGYQAANTLGRKLVRGEKSVNILERKNMPVRADIRVLNSLSAHADQAGLVNFSKNANPKEKIFLVHGEDKSKTALREKLVSAVSCEVVIPKCKSSHELL